MTRPLNRPVPVGAGVLLALALSTLAAGPARGAGPLAIRWHSDLGAALREARARNLPVWVQFTGPWCPNCHRLERETLIDPRVVASSREGFIPVKLRTDLNEALVAHFGLEGIPATIVLMPSGELLSRHEGFLAPDEFLAMLDGASTRSGLRREALASGEGLRKPRADSGPKGDAISLAGYCPVTLVREHRLVPGQPDQSLEHLGREYRFADARTRRLFRDQPERFVPVNSGRCPVRQVDRGDSIAGDPRWGVLYHGHLFLCADRAGRDRFLKTPERYAYVDGRGLEACPHCWARESAPDRAPRLSIARAPRLSIARAPQPSILRPLAPLDALRTATDRILR